MRRILILIGVLVAIHVSFLFVRPSGAATESAKDAIKVGRGGPDEWVDLKLLTSKDVSREHFQIRRDASTGKFFIKDLSKFGTSIDGHRVPPSIKVVNGIETDEHVEIPLPSKATINLADILSMRFKALKKK